MAAGARLFCRLRRGNFVCEGCRDYADQQLVQRRRLRGLPDPWRGKVSAIEKQKIAGHELELFVITFDRDRMTLRVPVPKAKNSGLRKLSTSVVMDAALNTLATRRARSSAPCGAAAPRNTKPRSIPAIPIAIAEVVRDLYRNANQPDQSYSERQIYEAALERLASELAAVERIEPEQATQKLEKLLEAA